LLVRKGEGTRSCYSLINQNIDLLLETLKPDVEVYVNLLAKLRSCQDVATNLEFRKAYQEFWILYPARLSAEFTDYYFAELGRRRFDSKISVEAVARTLLQVPTHSNGKRSVQFSFASKLVHMLRPSLPIYDGMVAQFFFLPDITKIEGSEKKLAKLCEFYDFLVDEYKRVLGEGLLADAILKFRSQFSVRNEYTDEKIIDALIWKFVTLANKGHVVGRKIVYA
jgi:hypothetical protein